MRHPRWPFPPADAKPMTKGPMLIMEATSNRLTDCVRADMRVVSRAETRLFGYGCAFDSAR